MRLEIVIGRDARLCLSKMDGRGVFLCAGESIQTLDCWVMKSNTDTGPA